MFEIKKMGSLALNTKASLDCFTYWNLIQNGAKDMQELLTC